MNSHPIILFDGICNLCNSTVSFLIKRDKKSVIQFAALQSEPAKKLLEQFNLPTHSFNSLILIEKGVVYTQSTAALKICKHLNGLWPLLYGLIIVPKLIRNGCYQLIAKNRYRWFGKQEKCMLPSPEVSDRFL
jgi:predicted DCC family thiol-disulfide oxidoreductase YuxK